MLMVGVKKRAKKTAAAESSSVVGTFKPSLRSKLPNLKTKQSLAIGGAALLVIITVGALLIVDRYRENSVPVKQLISEEQASKEELEDFKKNPPADNATKQEKVSYYGRLSVREADNNNFQEAINAKLEQKSVDESSMTYRDYLQLAQYYESNGNKDKALAALDVAAALVPEVATSEDEPSPSIIRQAIETQRKSITQ